jgi:hemerythrin
MHITTDSFIQWDASFSVGIDEIDQQHQGLISLLNELHEATLVQHGSDVCDSILNQLIEQTRIHFAVEESLMRILAYQDYQDHKYHHDQLLNQVLALKEKVHQGRRSISFELLHFLKQWLIRHIIEEDNLYVAHFKAGLVLKPKRTVLYNIRSKVRALFK